METGGSAAWGRGGVGQTSNQVGLWGEKGMGGGLTVLGVLYQSWKQIKATPPSPKKTCGKVTSETDLSGAPGWCSQLNGPTPGFGSGGAVILGGRDQPMSGSTVGVESAQYSFPPLPLPHPLVLFL